MSRYQDYRRRRSFSYRFKRWFERWFWEDHTKEIKQIFCFIGEFILSLLWFGMFIFLPHFFH